MRTFIVSEQKTEIGKEKEKQMEENSKSLLTLKVCFLKTFVFKSIYFLSLPGEKLPMLYYQDSQLLMYVPTMKMKQSLEK